MNKYLITGGCGFIGSNYLNIMVKKNPNISYVCLDALTYAGNLKNIENLNSFKNFTFIKGDITNSKFINDLFKKENFDVVINFAAETHVDNSFSQIEKFMNTNVEGTKILLDTSIKYKIKHFHQVSTDEVYGDMPLNSNKKFNENSPLNPSNPYSKSKALADLLVISYFNKYQLQITISRSSNNYGDNQHQEKFIPHSIKSIANNNNIQIYGNGKNVRDWIHVIDHVNAIESIINNGRNGEIYNIAGHNLRTNNSLAKEIIKILNTGCIEYVKDRPYHDKKYSLDTSKIENELNFYPAKSFKIEFPLVIKNYYKLFKIN